MRFFLIDEGNKRVVSDFEAVDLPAARVVGQQFVQANGGSCILVAPLRRIRMLSTPPSSSVDDQPA